MEITEKLNPNVVNAPISGIRKIADAVMQMKDVIRMDIGEPDFDTPKHIRDAAIMALNEGFTHYTAAPGIWELRKAVAEKLERDNRLNYDPESEVTITSGGIGGIFSALQALVNPGD